MHDYEHTLEGAAEARVRDFAGGCDAVLTIGQPTRLELLALHRMYGERIAEARTLADMSLADFAARLGISAHGAIKLERGCVAEIPAWLLARVASVTTTRLDYLAGLSDESEQGEDSELKEIVVGAMLDADTECAIHALGQVRQQQRLNDLERLAGQFERAAAELLAALRQVAELNHGQWPEMRGGVRLEAAVTACVRAARHASAGVA